MQVPLVDRADHAQMAWLSQALTCLEGRHGVVTVAEFYSHVEQLAATLPKHAFAINLCDNRYLFLVTLCAVVINGGTNLLPPNKNLATQQQLLSDYRDCYVVHDGIVEICQSTAFDVSKNHFAPAHRYSKRLQVSLEHVAVISFTSGSTGQAKPNIKSWRTLLDSTEINMRYMLPNLHDTFYHLATVPAQHMWGLETSVLMALFGKVCISDARPMYPHDIRQELAKLPAPRTLIGTPLHLRALIGSQQELSALANVLCATSPLDKALAENIENRYSTTLREVFGCSEVGSMAVRRTAQTELWSKFDGLMFVQDAAAKTTVSAAHLPQQIILEDRLELVDQSHFRLLGRDSDQIKVAGKRGSLTQANTVLLKFSGLSDGVVLFPPQSRGVPRLVALVVLNEGVTISDVRSHCRQYLDSAFVPRPILAVAKLPREDNGKLVKARLHAFYQSALANLKG